MNKMMIGSMFLFLVLPAQAQEVKLPSSSNARVLLDIGKWIVIGSSEPYTINDAVLCDSPELVKQFVDENFLAGHFPSGCGPYDAEKSSNGKVLVTMTYLENYDGKAVVVEFDPQEAGLRSFYGCLRLRQSVASQAL